MFFLVLRSHFNNFIEMHITSCVNKLDVLIMRVEIYFKTRNCCILPCSACCLATTHAPNQEININNTAALVEHWCHHLTSETTVKSVQATILHHLITLTPNKNGSKMRFSRPWTLLVSYSNYHSIESSHDKCSKFQA